LEQCFEHIGLTFISLFLAILLAVPAGIWITRHPKWAPSVLGFAGVLQTIPSIALLGFMIPILGIGIKPAVFALFLYAILPILRNTYTGIQEVEEAVTEAARGMGMTSRQILRKVELPLALPVIFAGVRTATVINVGVATLASYIGAGGLGEFIFGGIALDNSSMVLAGAIPAALLAVFFDQLLAYVQQRSKRTRTRQDLRILVLVPVFCFFYLLPGFFTSGLVAGFDPEFAGREDGYPSLLEKYELRFNTLMLNAGLMYRAIKEKEVDVISGYATDGRVKAYDLVLLEDDRYALPPYFCAPIIRKGLENDHPEAIQAIELLAGKISDERMIELNYQVDHLKKSPEEVATAFLKEEGLWKPDQKQGGATIAIGSKIFTEQYILVELYSQLINGHTDLDVAPKPGLGGTKICFEALANDELDLYAEYTGTGFQVILSPPETVVNDLIDDPQGVYEYVKNAFEEQYGIRWLSPLGFNNAYALMVRKADAQKYGWQKISDLELK
jgi:osmoprotectant transport system permease protein